MIVSCHQPNYLPHLGFFDKMKKSDVFVIYDGVQFSDGFYQHRNRIRTQNGWMWLTIPVERKIAPLNTIRIRNNAFLSKKPWHVYHWENIYHAYHKTPYFEIYRKEFEKIFLENTYNSLTELTIAVIMLLHEITGIHTTLVRHSDLHITSDDASERLAMITETLGGDTYLSGPSGGTKYELNENEFTKRNIKVAHQEFHHPQYPQYHARFDGKFEKNLASIDALFNTGMLPI